MVYVNMPMYLLKNHTAKLYREVKVHFHPFFSALLGSEQFSFCLFDSSSTSVWLYSDPFLHMAGGGEEEFWRGNLQERNHSEDLGVDGRIILRWILKKCEWDMAWIYLTQDRDSYQDVFNTVMNIWVS